MVPILSQTQINSQIDPFKSLIEKGICTQADLDEIVLRTRQGGAEIVNLLQTGSASFAPAAATQIMIDSILNDEKKLVTACCYLTGEFGVQNLYMGVPVRLGRNGAEEIIEVPMTEQEKKWWDESVEATRALASSIS